ATAPFVYPPLALGLFLPLARLPLPSAAALWMGLDAVVLVGLVILWRGLFPRLGVLALALCAVYGWNASGRWALAVGNVAWIEAGLVWAGLACFIAGRRAAFAAL